jgi:hypothetical protein
VAASLGELRHQLEGHENRGKGRTEFQKSIEFERKEKEDQKQIRRKAVEVDEFPNLDNAPGEFVPPKEVHSKNDKLRKELQRTTLSRTIS